MREIYAEVILSIPQKQIDRVFHYRVPENLRGKTRPGMRAIVSFGAGGKEYEATIIGLTDTTDVAAEKIKDLLAICGDDPIFTEEMLTLAQWMRDKYYTTYADCLKCVEPAGCRLKQIRLPRTRRVSQDPTDPPELTPEQSRVLTFMLEKINVRGGRPVLLHGVTGSGKTEIYMRIIEQQILLGRQAIVLVPEISLTPQTAAFFTNRFPTRVAVTHSRLSRSERYDCWRKAKNGEVSVMIGPRSAVFTPFSNLGVIIIDEEHEHTYKSEVSPKYSALEIARQRGKLTGAAVVLGSATPSVSTYYQAARGEFEKAVLRERVNQTPPEITIVDMRRELAVGNRSIFSQALRASLEENIANGKQSILFLNRRGHSTFVSCRKCGAVLKCENCSVNYTYHIATDTLVCHTCGARTQKPALCPVCGSKYIKYFGVGTQKVEEETKKIFPAETVLRMDMDTTGGKNGHEKLLNIFRQGGASILIGTQMIAKGLDFPNVTLVGVVAADVSLNNGDFRAGETTFQLLTQVSGRAGRAHTPGKVFIQTYNPGHYSIVFAKEQNYEDFYRHEIALRRQMVYPPFSFIFSVLFSCAGEKQIIILLHKLADILKANDDEKAIEILGPAPAQIFKIKNRYRWKLLIKGLTENSLKNHVINGVRQLNAQNDMTGVTQQLTLDPVMIE